MSSHVLRSFLYLDTETINNYLSSLGLLAESESVKEVKEKVNSVSGGATHIVKAEGKRESKHLVENVRQIVHTDAKRLQTLYEFLESESILKYYEDMDEGMWNSINRNDILEVDVELVMPKMAGFMSSLASIEPMMVAMEQAGQQAPLSHEQRQMLALIQQLSQMNSAANVPLSMPFAANPNYVLVGNLSPLFLKAETSRMTGQATLLCKVQRKLHPGEEYEVFNILSMMQAFAVNDEIKTAMNQGIAELPKEFRDTVNAPGAIISPIAIYR